MSQTGSGGNVVGRWGLLPFAEIKKPPHREGCEGREFHVLSMDTQTAAAPVGTTSTPTSRMRPIPLHAMRLLPVGNTTSRGSAEYDMRAYSLQPPPLLVKAFFASTPTVGESHSSTRRKVSTLENKRAETGQSFRGLPESVGATIWPIWPTIPHLLENPVLLGHWIVMRHGSMSTVCVCVLPNGAVETYSYE